MTANRCKVYFATMLRNAVRPLPFVAAAVLAGACQDVVEPGLSLSLGRTGRNVTVRSDSIAVARDSVRVTLSGAGAAQASWVAVHGGEGAVTLLDSSGTGSGWLRWTRDETVPPGVVPFVDTIRVQVTGVSALAAVLVDSVTVTLAPTPYITVRRAWRPGERDSAISAIIANRTLTFPYVGDISDNASALLPVDSTTEIVANPAYAAPGRAGSPLDALTLPAVGWTILGLRLRFVNNDEGGVTLGWMGYVFYETADPTRKGLVIAEVGSSAAVNKIVNTPDFDASFGTSGAGGGESQASTATYWQANGTGSPNRIRVTASSFTGTITTVTSGPFLGGTMRSGLMTGSLQQVVMTRVLGSGGDAADTANVTVSNLPSTFYECIFPTPCTTNALMAPGLRTFSGPWAPAPPRR